MARQLSNCSVLPPERSDTGFPVFLRISNGPRRRISTSALAMRHPQWLKATIRSQDDAAVVLPGPTLSVLRPQHRRSAELGATREADVPNTDPSWTLCDSCK